MKDNRAAPPVPAAVNLGFADHWWIFQRRGTPVRRHSPAGLVVASGTAFLAGWLAAVGAPLLAIEGGLPLGMVALMLGGGSLALVLWRYSIDGQGVRIGAWITGAGMVPMVAIVTAAYVDAFARFVFDLWLLFGPALAVLAIVREMAQWYRRDPLEAYRLAPGDRLPEEPSVRPRR